MSDQTKWTLDTSDWPLIINDGDYCMAIIHSAESDPQRAEFRPSNADAEKAGRLMAAAPELLAACKAASQVLTDMAYLMDRMDDDAPGYLDECEAWEAALSILPNVIAKATTGGER